MEACWVQTVQVVPIHPEVVLLKVLLVLDSEVLQSRVDPSAIAAHRRDRRIPLSTSKPSVLQVTRFYARTKNMVNNRSSLPHILVHSSLVIDLINLQKQYVCKCRIIPSNRDSELIHLVKPGKSP